jgi:CheY-like chemotaxis protein
LICCGRPIPRYGPRYHYREIAGDCGEKHRVAAYFDAIRRTRWEFRHQQTISCMPVHDRITRLWASNGNRLYTNARWGPVVALLGRGEATRLAGVRSVAGPFVGVVDDDEGLCSSLVDLMRAIGHRAEAFGSADALLASDSLFSFDCIIADVHMHGMSGIDLIRGLREQRIMTPVILVTALPHRHLDGEAASAGAFRLLRKPFEASVLLDCIERSLLK